MWSETVDALKDLDGLTWDGVITALVAGLGVVVAVWIAQRSTNANARGEREARYVDTAQSLVFRVLEEAFVQMDSLVEAVGVLDAGLGKMSLRKEVGPEIERLVKESDTAKDQLLIAEQQWSVFVVHDDNSQPAAEVLGAIDEFWTACRKLQNLVLDFMNEALRDEQRYWSSEQIPRLKAIRYTGSVPAGEAYDDMRNRIRIFMSSLGASSVPDRLPKSLASSVREDRRATTGQ